MSKGLYVYDPVSKQYRRRYPKSADSDASPTAAPTPVSASNLYEDSKPIERTLESLHRHEEEKSSAIWKRVLWIFIMIGIVIMIAITIKDYLAGRRLSAPNKGGRPNIERVSPLDELTGH